MKPLLIEGLPGEARQIIGGDAAHQQTCSIEDDPKLREECGVVAVYGHPDAARQVYLALYALQHRGQESAGIAVADGKNLSNIKGMGLVAEIFTDDVLDKLQAIWPLAIRATRLPAIRRC